ncbi:MAG TPA: hypothetical protein VGC71_16515 [Gaiellales bacterium]
MAGRAPGVTAHRIAYVAEDSELDDLGPVALGTFSAHVEDGADLDAPFEHMATAAPLPEAVAWARGRADRVIVRLCGFDGEYSAGAVPVEDAPQLPEGLDPAPRRAAGWEFLDRTPDDEEIDWDVVVGAGTIGLAALQRPGARPTWAAVRSALAADARVIAVAAADIDPPVTISQTGWAAYANVPVAVLRASAPTVGEAESAACQIVAEIAFAVGVRTSDGSPFGCIGIGAYPTGSRAASANARLGHEGLVW